MPNTPKLALPYPVPGDPADVPTDMGELATRIDTVAGTASGLATLGADGKVPTAQLPPAPVIPDVVYKELGNASRASDLALTTGLQQVLALGPITTPACSAVLEFFLPGYVSAHTAQVITLYLQADGNGDAFQLPLVVNSGYSYAPVFFRRRIVLSAAAHSFDVQAVTSAVAATLKGGAGGGTTGPMLLTLTRVA